MKKIEIIENKAKEMKSVSIVIPCRNEEKFIAKCLNSIVENHYPKEYLTVVICDGNSEDRTPEIIEKYVNEYDYIFTLKNPHLTTPYALNLGIQHTVSDIVIILGAHSYIAPDFIEKSIYHLDNDSSAGCVGGIIENIYETENSRIIGYAMSRPFGVGSAHFRTGNREGYVDTVSFGAYRREVFDVIGYFDTELVRNQDDEFNFRLTQAGYKILLTKDIKSYYYVRANFKKLFSQYYQYGYWKIWVNIKHKQITTIRQIVPLLFLLFIVAGITLSIIFPKLSLVFITFIFIYLITGFTALFKKKLNIKSRFKALYCFMILHTAYGLGYAHGILHFFVFSRQPNKKMKKITR